jgi:hypothetical protein
LFQAGSARVEETTYLRMPFILSAKPPSSVRSGQAAAKPSYVRRPSSRASASMSSSSLNLSPSSPRSNANAQPPCSKPSAPPGSSITPSSVTNSETTMRPISSSSVIDCRRYDDATARNSSDDAAASAARTRSTAPGDAGDIGMRTSGVGIRPSI